MTGEFPDEWFRPAREHGTDGTETAQPQGGAGAARPNAPTAGASAAGGTLPGAAPGGRATGAGTAPGQVPEASDERYTDQFKPGWVERPSARRQAAAAPGARPQDATGQGSGGPHTGGSHSVGVAPTAVVEEYRPPVRQGQRKWPLAVAGVALLGVGLGIGMLVNQPHESSTTDPSTSTAPLASVSDSPTGQASPSASSSDSSEPWNGAVRTVQASSVKASCTAPTQTGYDNQPVPSDASRVLDGRMSTGWRCNGSGLGQKLTFTFPAGTKVVGVRLTNGYTKTVGGESLYPQYRRITEVTWSFPGADNAYFQQGLTDGDQSLQEIRIPPTSADGGMQLQVTKSTAPGTTESTREAVVITEVEFLIAKG